MTESALLNQDYIQIKEAENHAQSINKSPIHIVKGLW